MRAQRVERVAAAIVVGCLAWLVAPGRIQPDTKLDLTVSPWRYVARSLDAWNGHAGLGELQNQAYGYLWPMGPFFLLGGLVDLPGWVVQRLWQGLVMSVALAKLQAYQDASGRFIPVREIGAPSNSFNFISNVKESLNAARPGRFNGVVLNGGVHMDSMRGGNPLIQFLATALAGALLLPVALGSDVQMSTSQTTAAAVLGAVIRVPNNPAASIHLAIDSPLFSLFVCDAGVSRHSPIRNVPPSDEPDQSRVPHGQLMASTRKM